jgi:hypothetical protein
VLIVHVNKKEIALLKRLKKPMISNALFKVMELHFTSSIRSLKLRMISATIWTISRTKILALLNVDLVVMANITLRLVIAYTNVQVAPMGPT